MRHVAAVMVTGVLCFGASSGHAQTSTQAQGEVGAARMSGASGTQNAPDTSGAVSIASAQLPAASEPLPLSGAAYRVAQDAYAAYARHDYPTAVAAAREAIRQRPDVASLRLLLANALAAERHSGEASRSGPGSRELPGDPNALTGAALTSAQQAYNAYDAKDFPAAVRYANEAIAQRPDVLRLRLLMIDAASAAGQDADAWSADLDAVRRFGDRDELSLRRRFIGNRLAPKASGSSYAALKRGDDAQAVALARQTVEYEPDKASYRVQLIDTLFATNDLAGVQAAASAAIAADDIGIMLLTLHGYALAAQGKTSEADTDFSKVQQAHDATQRNQRIARVIIADVWIAEGEAQRALDLLAPLKTNGDDTDPPIALRRYQARQLLAKASSQVPAVAPARAVTAQAIDPARRPVIDCTVDQFGASCDVYAADPGFFAARASAAATTAKDRTGAVGYAREAVKAAPDDPQHRIELIDALSAAGDAKSATREARRMIDAGMDAAMPDLSAAYIAQRAGDSRLAYEHFRRADEAGQLPARANADAGYAAWRAHRNRDAAKYFERAIDANTAVDATIATSAAPTTSAAPAVPKEVANDALNGGNAPVTPIALNDIRSAHADVTRNWGFNVSMNYRGAGIQPGFSPSPAQSTSNNWQTGVEAYWRPFGSLGDRMFEVYARGYESFGVKGGSPSGADTLQAAVGARAKPFSQIDAIVAFERIIPIGSSVNPDWLARLAYSGGFGTARRVDVPSWWTAQIYAEAGHYLNGDSTYATTNLEFGRTFRMDRYSPKWTVFPYAVIGADYDSTVDHSIPLGAGIGISTRYWMRDSMYDTPRSYIDLSVQYRLKITGDDRARGVFFGATYSY
ncbi:NfrA family protein [Paraburkholderia megapolitana]|nr:bacteriophage N4 adsorption protein A [Paraburkholderia megapolitana]QDQ81106.1 bacteriophage N4 adsorption protein A [Paraburkholderia megapolitana]